MPYNPYLSSTDAHQLSQGLHHEKNMRVIQGTAGSLLPTSSNEKSECLQSAEHNMELKFQQSVVQTGKHFH